MSLSSDNMMKLMAYADGELEGNELEEAQKLLATEGDAARFVEQVAGLGSILERGHEARSGQTIAKFDVADAIMARVNGVNGVNQEKAADKPRVVSLASRASRDKRGTNIKLVGGFAAVLALAASIFLFTQHKTDETPMASGPLPGAIPPASVAVATSGTGVDVSTVNSPGNSVSVFYLPTANELSTSVVVWVDEPGEK